MTRQDGERKLIERVNPGLRHISPYVPGTSIEEARRTHPRCGFVKMASNENPLGTSPRTARALARSRRRCFQYPDPSGLALREALARRFAMQPAQMILGNGADGILYTLAMTLLADGDEALIPEVTFSLYGILVQAMRGRVLTTAMKDHRPELEDFLRELAPQVFVVYDEVYFDFTDPGVLPDVLELLRRERRNLIVVRSFSKVYGLAGARLGYAAAEPPLIELMNRVRPPFEVSVPALTAGRAALEDRLFYENTLSLTRRGRLEMSQRLVDTGLAPVPSHTNFILVDVGRDSRALAARLLEQGYIVRADLSDRLTNYIRITLGTEPQNRGLLKALGRVIR